MSQKHDMKKKLNYKTEQNKPVVNTAHEGNGDKAKAGTLKIIRFLSFLLWAVLSVIMVNHAWLISKTVIETQTLQTAKEVAVSMNGEMLKYLRGLPEDEGTVPYESIKSRLIAVAELHKEVRFAYLYTQKADTIYIMADSEPVGSKDMSPPGQKYTEASASYSKAFETGIPIITTLATDRWGTWISVLVPIKNLETGKTRAVFGMDYPAKNYYKTAKTNIAIAGAIVLLVFLLLALFFRILSKTGKLKAEQNKSVLVNLMLTNSEEKHRLLIEHSHDIIYMLTKEGVFTFVSPAWTILLGHPANMVVGKSFQQFVHPDDIPACLLWLQKVIETRQRQEGIEYRVRHADGTWFWHTSSAVPIKDDNGEIIEFEGTARDITERKLAEKKLRQSEEKYKVITEQSPIAIELYDETGSLISVNPACLELFGVGDINEIMQFSLFDDPNITAERKSDLKQGKNVHYEVLFDFDKVTELNLYTTSKSGQIMLDVIITIIRNDDIITGYLSQIQDITERKQAEKTLVTAKESAEENDRLKSSFLANMSHELRTPLSGILGFSELLGTQLQNKESRDMAIRINESGNRLLNTLNLVLDLSRIEANMQKVHRTTVDVNNLLQSAVELFEPAAAAKGLKLTFTPNIPELFMLTDGNMLEHTFNELINNAIKYTDTGSITVITNMLIADEDSRIIIEVRDTGIGISKDNQAAAFDAFRQVSEGLGRSFEGTGLGLTICKKYINLLGGEIMLESDLGCGSSFSVSFPADTLHPEQGNNAAEIDTTPPKATQEGEPQQLPKVLLVDDDDMTPLLVIQMLQGVVEIDYAATGAEGVSLLTDNTYVMFLLDINLKIGLSGFDVLNEIRKLPKYESTPIIAITAYAMMGDKEVFLSQGFTDYISKPFTGSKLNAIVQRWL